MDGDTALSKKLLQRRLILKNDGVNFESIMVIDLRPPPSRRQDRLSPLPRIPVPQIDITLDGEDAGRLPFVRVPRLSITVEEESITYWKKNQGDLK